MGASRNVPMPDAATWNREVARRERRMELIKQHGAREENVVDFRNVVKQTRAAYRQKIAEVQNDVYLPEKARHDLLADLSREYSTAMNTARADAHTAYEAELDRLDRQTNPAPDRSSRTADQVAVRRELREDLEARWKRDQVHVLAGYREAVRLGDTMAMELHEQYGREFISDQDLRREFADMTAPQKAARLTPAQQSANEALEALKAEEPRIMLGIEHQVSLAANEARNAASGRPVQNRDTAIGAARQRGMNTDAVEKLSARAERNQEVVVDG